MYSYLLWKLGPRLAKNILYSLYLFATIYFFLFFCFFLFSDKYFLIVTSYFPSNQCLIVCFFVNSYGQHPFGLGNFLTTFWPILNLHHSQIETQTNKQTNTENTDATIVVPAFYGHLSIHKNRVSYWRQP